MGVISRITIIISAISAVFESDVKKVVALSTLRQLGVMMLAISVGAISVCFFHLVSHALFKALMFLCVGGVIHFTGVQDLRYLGGLINTRPVIISWLGVACFSLMGFPFISGFYSKDLVLEAFLSGGLNIVLCFMVVLSTCLTAIYRGWLIYGVFFSSINFSSGFSIISNSFLSIPCSLLGVGAVVGGMRMQCLILEFNTSFEVLGMIKLVPFGCVVIGITGLVIYITSLNLIIFRSSNLFNTTGMVALKDSLAKI